MNKVDRNKTDKPICLVEKAEKWTVDFIEKRETKPKYWNWHQYKKRKVEHILTEALTIISDKRCAYCEIRPLVKGGLKPSIDHFKPKSTYKKMAFEWTNLFLACYQCQEYKGSKYPDIEPLKPDTLEYDFDYWFEINWETYKIHSNPLRNVAEQERAEKTIEWLGLNRDNRAVMRSEELEKYESANRCNIDVYSYKFLLERS